MSRPRVSRCELACADQLGFRIVGHYLRPVELLRLIRVSKPLRLLFTSKRDSGRVWTHAYENAAFPNLVATDWDSIYLANMLHGEPICLVCDESTGQVTRDFENRMLIHDVRFLAISQGVLTIFGQLTAFVRTPIEVSLDNVSL